MCVCLWLQPILGFLWLQRCILGLRVHGCTVTVSVGLLLTWPGFGRLLLALGKLGNWSSESTVGLDCAWLGLRLLSRSLLQLQG